MMIDTTSGVTKAQGFQAAGVAAGIRKSGKRDLALVVSEGPQYAAAAVFTSNRFAAAPVAWSRQVVAGGTVRAVILNSGGANACTGPQGAADAQAMAEQVGAELGVSPSQVVVCSTGLIGDCLPMDKVASGITEAVGQLSEDGGEGAAWAILTTDQVIKQAAYTSPSGWSIGGMAKGAGMLAPALATMLVVITTDVSLTSAQADQALRAATRISFDRADSDGCMSTNDAVVLLANGAYGVVDASEFQAALDAVCLALTEQLIADAEGAEHAIAITVQGAVSEDEAVTVARAVARSNLFKCAIAGNDPNWGRVLAAIGTTDAQFDPAKVDVFFNGVGVFLAGAPGRPRGEVDLKPFEVDLVINLRAGDQSATLWTNDLTHGYVSENADYSS